MAFGLGTRKPSRSPSMMREPLVLGILATGNILLSAGQYAVLLVSVGPGAATDAFFAGAMVPQYLQAVAFNALTSVIVPILSTAGARDFGQLVWIFVIDLGLVFVVGAALLALSCGIWLPLLLPGFTDDVVSSAVMVGRVYLLAFVFNAISVVLWCALRAGGRFVRAEAAAAISSAIALLGMIVLLPAYGVMAAAWMLVLRAVLQTIMLIPSIMPFSFPGFYHESLREAWGRIRPLAGGALFYKVTILVDRSLLSLAPASGMSLLVAAQQIYGALEQVVNRALVVPLVPRLARMGTRRQWAGFAVHWKKVLRQVLSVTLILFLGIVLLGPLAISRIDSIGNFESGELALLWLLLIAMFGQLVISPCASVVSSIYYSLGNTILPTVIGVLATVLGIAFRVVGFRWGGTVALAGAISLQYLVAFGVLRLFVLKHTRAASVTEGT
jgi:putative peptidoglycan lipid II flippase